MRWLIAAPIIIISLGAGMLWEAWCISKLEQRKSFAWFPAGLIGIYVFVAPGAAAALWASDSW